MKGRKPPPPYHRDSDSVRCTVKDDGVGFDVQGMLAKPGERGLGLMGIRERLSALGGTLVIDSTPGRGTELAITLPLKG